MLTEASTYDDTVVINKVSSLSYERLLGQMYRSWSRHRINTVVSLLQGSEKPLQISAAAVVLALIVNRCTSEDRALTRFASGTARDVVDAAFFTPVQAFHDIFAPKRRGNRANPRLVSGWMLGEARRRLGDALVVIDARGGRNGKVWIRPVDLETVIDTVARDLVRGHRKRATPQLFGEAFDALVEGLRQELPRLAGYGLVHERPPETDRLRERVIARLARYSLATT
jgi:hypothetical protein